MSQKFESEKGKGEGYKKEDRKLKVLRFGRPIGLGNSGKMQNVCSHYL